MKEANSQKKIMNILYIVVPCYNEEEVLYETTKRLTSKMSAMIDSNIISEKSRIMYINDGSKDNTWKLINQFHEENDLVAGINLSRNRGHQNALLAGLMAAKKYADIVISMDADLQDDINVVDEFVSEYLKGSDIVYGVRKSREKDTFFKRFTAQGFYKTMKMLGVDIVYNHADYRLMSKRALEVLEKYTEVNLFLRGIIPLVGFKSSTVEYVREERFAGESKYPLKKMIAFAVEGITSFSIKPIRLITSLGFMIFGISLIMLVYFLVIHIQGITVQGWTTIVISVWAIGGLQLLSIGIIGEYIGKVYLESKHRPNYIIESIILKEE